METRENEGLETRYIESLLLYVSLLSLIDAKRQFPSPQVANDQMALPQQAGSALA
jgi:hypothetical protein